MKLFIYVALLLVGACNCQVWEKCGDIPYKDLSDINHFIKYAPFTFVNSLGGIYNCGTRFFAYPKKGQTNYTGSSIFVKGNTFLVNKVTLSADNKTATIAPCDGSAAYDVHAIDIEFTDDGSFLCAFGCNGDLFSTFYCYQNNAKYTDRIKKVLESVAKIGNYGNIKDDLNCQASQACPFLN